MMTSARPRSRALTRQRRTLRWATQCQPLSVLLTLNRLILLLVPGKKREMRHTVLVRVHPPKVAWAVSRMSDAADQLEFKVAELKRLVRRAEGEAVDEVHGGGALPVLHHFAFEVFGVVGADAVDVVLSIHTIMISLPHSRT